MTPCRQLSAVDSSPRNRSSWAGSPGKSSSTRFAVARLKSVVFGVTLLVVRPGFCNNPQLAFEIGSGTLWELGWRRSWELCRSVARAVFGHPPDREQISRLDLCVDVGNVDFGRSNLEHWVTRARSKTEIGTWKRHTSGAIVSSLQWGARGKLMCRIYDKLREIREQSKRRGSSTSGAEAPIRCRTWCGGSSSS